MNGRTILACAVSAALGAATVAAVSTAADTDNVQHYTVEAADTWSSIATAHDVSADALQLANNLAASTSNSAHPRTGWVIHIPEAPAPTTTAPTTTAPTTVAPTTVAPSTTSTTPPTTAPAPSSTTTSSTVSSTTVPPSSTTSPSSTTTTLPSGAAFFEDFSTPNVFCGVRFDCGWSGEVAAGAQFGDNANDWPGDHDVMCADPNATHRTVHVEPGRGLEPGTDGSNWAVNRDISQAFYQCAPGGDPTKAHAMVSTNTEGYTTVWFSPKQTFTDVKRVCWDQNITDLKPEKWTGVLFLVPSEYTGPNSISRGRLDLGYDTHDFPDGPTADQGPALNGISTHQGTVESFSNGANRFSFSRGTNTDKAGRYQHCVVDNDNGTLTVTVNRVATVPGVPPSTNTIGQIGPGSIPDGPIRVVFTDEQYNPDKHQVPEVPRDSSGLYTWHWDNLLVS